MKTIKSHLFNRLEIQAKEADVRGFSKLAESITAQVELNAESVRSDDEMYSYAKAELNKNLNDHLWSSIIRMADFYDVPGFDPEAMQNMVDKTAENLIHEFCAQNQISHGVGAFEPKLPGQELTQVILEIE